MTPSRNESDLEPAASRPDRSGPPWRLHWRGWWNFMSDRERVISSLKTLAWVAPLTVLVWIYAEREQQSDIRLTVPVQVLSDSPNRAVGLVDSPDRAQRDVMIRLRGPQQTLQDLREALAQPAGAPQLIVTVGRDTRDGEQSIYIANQIANASVFRNSPVTVVECQPDVLRVRVEQLVTRELVVVPFGAGNIEREDIAFVPPKVKVTAPPSVFQTVEETAGTLSVSADVSRFANRRPDRYEEEVPLEFPHASDNVTLPRAVRAVVDIKRTIADYTISSVPVMISTPKGLQDEYRIDYQESVQNVQVRGPREQIELLEKRTFIPKAYLELTRQEVSTVAPGERREKKLLPENFYLPQDVAVPPGTEITVWYAASKRE